MKIYFVCLFLTFCAINSSIAQSVKAVSLYEKAKELELKRQFPKAKGFYHKAIKADKKYDKPYLSLAGIHKIYGEKVLSIEVYEKMLESVGDDIKYAPIYLDIANYYSKKAEYLKAKDYLMRYNSVADNSNKYFFKAEQLLVEVETREKATLSGDTENMPRKLFKGIHFASYPVALSDSSLIVNLKMMENRKSATVVAQSQLTKRGWTSLRSLSDNINTAADQGGCAFTNDGKKIIFTSCNRKDGFGSCDLYESILNDNGIWSLPQNLGANINTAFWESEPSITSDGKVLYFSSRRSGGYGKEDIWVSYWKDGAWTKAVNLGPEINTKEREVTPFIHPYGNQLYYAATGANTLGGFDLFVSLKKDKTWSKGVNLGYPINTNLNESALSLSEGGKCAFFARLTEAVNFGDQVSSKIYSVKIPDTLLVLEKSITEELIEKVEEKEVMTFSGVLFDYGSSELKKEFVNELNKLYLIMTTEKPNVSILIEGHTDNEGTAEYNKKLSLSRAESVQRYLMKKGISLSRIKIEGFGSNRPVSTNQTEEGRVSNRRIEIRWGL